MQGEHVSQTNVALPKRSTAALGYTEVLPLGAVSACAGSKLAPAGRYEASPMLAPRAQLTSVSPASFIATSTGGVGSDTFAAAGHNGVLGP